MFPPKKCINNMAMLMKHSLSTQLLEHYARLHAGYTHVSARKEIMISIKKIAPDPFLH